VEAWDSGDYKLAAEEYERYLEKDSDSEKAAEARFQLANIYYFKLQRYDQARTNYTTFLSGIIPTRTRSSRVNAWRRCSEKWDDPTKRSPNMRT
jgi:TolA-binding protein